MKIKLNQLYTNHRCLLEMITQEFPEITVKVKERKWGMVKPSFKYKKIGYEFDDIEELMAQIRKIIRLKDDENLKKSKKKIRIVEPEEDTFLENKVPVMNVESN